MQFNRHFINRIEKKDVLRLLLALVAVFVIGVLGDDWLGVLELISSSLPSVSSPLA